MKRITYLVFSAALIILMFIFGSKIKENSSASSNNTPAETRAKK